MNTLLPARRTARTIALPLAGWLLVITGTGHTVLVVLGTLATPAAAEARVREAMASSSLVVAGLERSHWDLFQGFSLMMALMIVGFGALLLLVHHRVPDLATGSRGLLALVAAVLVPALAISALLLPPPPILLLGLAAAAVVLALREPDAPPPRARRGPRAAD